MTVATSMDAVVAQLVPLESYRSPWIPTRRFSAPALLGMVGPLREVDRGTSRAPTHWFAVDPSRLSLIAFARTAAMTPVPDFSPSAVEPVPRTMHPRNAHTTLRDLGPDVWSRFFANRPLDGVIAEEVAAAYRAAVPDHLWTWLTLCCADFFRWLAPSC